MGIADELVRLSFDEGKCTAIQTAEDIRSSLESLMEMGTKGEKFLVAALLRKVEFGISRLCNGETWDDGSEVPTVHTTTYSNGATISYLQQRNS